MKKIVLILVSLVIIVSALWLANDKTQEVDISKTLAPTPFSEFKHKIVRESLILTRSDEVNFDFCEKLCIVNVFKLHRYVGPASDMLLQFLR